MSMGLVRALERKMVIATLDDDDNKPLVLPSRSPLRKGTTTVTDPASVAATESNNTACTSPLTITSLEAAAATASTSASASTVKSNNNTSWVPQVVSSRAVLSRGAGMGGIGIVSEASGAGIMEEGIPRKVHHRTPPTEHDNRKLFVGGLPTDGENERISARLISRHCIPLITLAFPVCLSIYLQCSD